MTAPTLSSSTPANNAENVATDSTILLNFDRTVVKDIVLTDNWTNNGSITVTSNKPS